MALTPKRLVMYALLLSAGVSAAAAHAQTATPPATPPTGAPATSPTTPPTTPAVGASTTPQDPQLVLNIAEPVSWSQTGTVATRDFEAAVATSIRVQGTAKHPEGIREIRLNHNLASTAPNADGSTAFIGYVRVEDKMTSAVVEVITNTGKSIPVTYNITPTQPAKPDAKVQTQTFNEHAAEAKATGKRWAVIIGISQYEDPAIPGLQYADADAKSVYNFFRSPLSGLGGFNPENMKVLLNKDATYKNMRTALFDFLKQAAPEDVVYIYYAGHGSPDPERRDDLYLLPYDARANSMGGTAFPMGDMNAALAKVTAAHKVLIIDACHSGGVTTGTTRGGLADNAINDAFLNKMTTSGGVQAILTASDKSQTSMESDKWKGDGAAGHGVFTYYLLKGLKGEADVNGDGIVDLYEMMKYVTDSVSQATARAQTPVIAPTAYDGSFPVALVLPGMEVKQISDDEIDSTNRATTIGTIRDQFPWIPSVDSVTLVVGGSPDTLHALLKNDTRDVIPSTYLTWSSSNPSMARVNANTGVVTAVGEGTVQITASSTTPRREVKTLITVMPRPSDVQFYLTNTSGRFGLGTNSTRDSNLVLVFGESFQVRTDLLFGNDQWMRGLAPQVATDALYLKQMPDLQFLADRAGTTKLTATIAGKTMVWNIRVILPNVKVQPLPVAMPLGDSTSLTGVRIRPNGTVLGDAPDISWRSLDTSRGVVRNGRLVATGIGRAQVVGTLANAVDTVSTFVLGDLLIATDGKAGPQIVTTTMGGGDPVSLLPKGMTGTEPALSPKGDRIAFVSNRRIYIMDPDGKNLHQLTPNMKGALGVKLSSYYEDSPTWTSDGSHVIFVSNAYGNYSVASVSTDGKQDVQRLSGSSGQEKNVAAAFDLPRIAFERDGDLVVALPNGLQPQQIHPPDPLFGEAKYSMGKPKFMPGGLEIVYVRRWEGGAESLHLMTLATDSTTKELVKRQKSDALLYAVSPNGQYIAYHEFDEWGGSKDNSITIIDRGGVVQKTFRLSLDGEIKSISWGASSSSLKGGK